jgi:hypothetical protein
MKRVSALFAIVLLIITGCATGPTTQAQLEDTVEPAPVELTMSLAVEGEQLTIKGTANVPDGALIFWEVFHEKQYSATREEIETLPEELFFRDVVEVKDGAWEVAQMLTDWPKGDVRISAAFSTVLVALADEETARGNN